MVAALEAEGFSVWWDAHIGGGSNWQNDIEQHLDAAKCVLVAWTKRSIGPDGHFVRDEARRAQRRDAYLPVCLDNVDPPLGFGEIQAVSLKGWKGDSADRRFQAVASAVRNRLTGEHGPAQREPLRRTRVSRRAALAGGIGVAAVAGASGWALLKPTPANARRIAVIPFANLSGDEAQAYFADGIAEELRSALRTLGMQVVGRASSNAVKDLDSKVAARRLDVANILTGSVRRSSAMIRVNAQLVGGSDGVERWGQSYDRAHGDAIRIQADIAQRVAKALSITLGQAARAVLTIGGTADPVAQDLIMQAGRVLATAQDEAGVRHSISLTEAAIARDPRYAGAYLAKARAHLTMSIGPIPSGEVTKLLAQADAEVRKAIALATKWGTPYTVMAEVESSRLEFASALRAAKRAVFLSPDDPNVVGIAAIDVTLYENVEAGLRLADRAIALDPLAYGPYANKALMLVFARQYRQAIELVRKARSIDPEGRWVNTWIGDAFLFLRQPDQAKTEYDAIDDDVFESTRLALHAAHTGNPGQASQLLAKLKREYGAATSYQHAQIHAQLGEPDQAFAELGTAVRRMDSGLRYLKLDPFLDPIRGDSRFGPLVQRLNFP